MEWCDRVVRLGGINQEDDRAVEGQTTNDLRPARWGSDTKRSAASLLVGSDRERSAPSRG